MIIEGMFDAPLWRHRWCQNNKQHIFGISNGPSINIKNKIICGVILPRSGLGHKHGIVLGNLVGLIDSDYQGEIFISLWIRTNMEYEVKPLDRVAQLVFMPVEIVKFNMVESFDQSNRGDAGFGSTGTN